MIMNMSTVCLPVLIVMSISPKVVIAAVRLCGLMSVMAMTLQLSAIIATTTTIPAVHAVTPCSMRMIVITWTGMIIAVTVTMTMLINAAASMIMAISLSLSSTEIVPDISA